MLLTGLMCCGVFVAGLGWLGVVLHDPRWAWQGQGLWRASSTLTYPNATAVVLAMLALLAIARSSAPAPSILLRLATTGLFTGLAATLSRAGLLALAVGILDPGRPHRSAGSAARRRRGAIGRCRGGGRPCPGDDLGQRHPGGSRRGTRGGAGDQRRPAAGAPSPGRRHRSCRAGCGARCEHPARGGLEGRRRTVDRRRPGPVRIVPGRPSRVRRPADHRRRAQPAGADLGIGHRQHHLPLRPQRVPAGAGRTRRHRRAPSGRVTGDDPATPLPGPHPQRRRTSRRPGRPRRAGRARRIRLHLAHPGHPAGRRGPGRTGSAQRPDDHSTQPAGQPLRKESTCTPSKPRSR